jgi:phosphomannomutase
VPTQGVLRANPVAAFLTRQSAWALLPGDAAALPKEDMLTLTLAGGAVATLRASGTEPKLKYYVEVGVGLGCIVALYYRSSALYQIP